MADQACRSLILSRAELLHLETFSHHHPPSLRILVFFCFHFFVFLSFHPSVLPFLISAIGSILLIKFLRSCDSLAYSSRHATPVALPFPHSGFQGVIKVEFKKAGTVIWQDILAGFRCGRHLAHWPPTPDEPSLVHGLTRCRALWLRLAPRFELESIDYSMAL